MMGTIKNIKLLYVLAVIMILFAGGSAIANDKEQNIQALTDMQKYVTLHDGTEKPFENEYWNNKEPGIYVDVISGRALFSSKDKFDSGTGWPSFTKPIEEQEIVAKPDYKLGQTRVEVRSKNADAHLGHVFDDGPKEHGGSRYCINSAALKFIPKEQMIDAGYGEYLGLIDKDYKYEKTVLAGGCFWGMEELLKELDGVVGTRVGYTGGTIDNATYDIVSTGTSGHAESVEVIFDPKKLSYGDVLKYFFRIHDPTTKNQQGNDKGTQYRSVIFYENDEQYKTAQDIIKKANESGVFDKPIVTELISAGKFYNAEDYHQDYLDKNPNGYTCHYIRDKWKF